MSRSHASAKKAGTAFERQIADYLKDELNDDRIDRRVKNGIKDKGDIAGLRVNGHRVVVECKNTSKTSLAAWITEAETERINDGAIAGVVAHKRHGKGQPEDQLVTMTLADFVRILRGE